MSESALDIRDFGAGVLHRAGERMPETVEVDAQMLAGDILQ
jgi:hypothetical protein